MTIRPAVLALSVACLLPGLLPGLSATAAVRAAVPLDYYLPAGTAYDPKVPTPEDFFGFQIGDWHLRSESLLPYLRAVAAAAPERVKLEIMGYSHEHKPLLLVTITSPANHRDLERIRTEHLALLDPAKNAALDPAKLPVVVDLGYSVHGNEPSGVNAMPLVVYHLAAAQGPQIEALLQNAVILVEAQRNPDGGDRAAHWFNTHRSLSAPSSDPADREHNQAWPRRRSNHYWFDPNRDWLPLVHPEAQARAALFHRWRPNIITDHHEMGTNSSFFFQPGVPTRNNPSIPPAVVELTGRIAAFHARALDGKGISYFSEQGYDDFYPGKGSTYPDLHGSIGILFEQASARGHVQESERGLVTFPFAIRNQVLTSLSTLEAALALKPDLLRLQRDFTAAALAEAARDPAQAYVFGDDGDPARAAAFLKLLSRHRIEVLPLTETVTAGGRTFAPGAAWVVPAGQPQYRLIKEMFVRRTEFADTVFYDVSAWTLPLAFNLPFAELPKVPAAGAPVQSTRRPPGKLVGGHAGYAYLFNWNAYYAPRALHRLQRAGIIVQGLMAPLEAVAADGTRASFAPGAVLVPLGVQPGRAAEIAALIDGIVEHDGVTVHGFATGLTPRGPDFGSGSFLPLLKPEVALITGQGVDPQEIGAAWHVLDQRVQLTPTLLDLAQLPRAELARYTTIVFADGAYDDAVTPATVAALKRWVREGGTLVVAGRAAAWAAKQELAAIDFVPAAPDVSGRQPYAGGADREAQKLVAGAVFAASVDVTHPLGYGFSSDRLSLCRAGTLVFKPAKSPYETPIVYTAKPLQSGYASAANQERIAGSAAALALPSGRGAVVALADDVNFRGFWYGGNRVFFNAIFYGDAIRAIRAGEEGDDAHSH